ncbi:MAG: hypothetical protein KBD15_01315 [Candidatus Magasanikbacteria bacterium]|jgi:hypothetical protein|nr:hypothetical protein [Candidatus Magasanikbacteria bacterium]
MLEHLFGSKTRLKLIRLFFREPDKKFFVREITRVLETQINAVRRELSVLLESGILQEVAEKVGSEKEKGPQKKYYILNKSSVLYTELQGLLLKDSMLGEEQFLELIKQKGGDILLLLVSGCFTGDKDAPSDMLLVGNIKEKTLTNLITDYEKEVGCAIRYTFMSEKEFQDRRHVMDRFLFSLFESKHLKLVNTLNVS